MHFYSTSILHIDGINNAMKAMMVSASISTVVITFHAPPTLVSPTRESPGEARFGVLKESECCAAVTASPSIMSMMGGYYTTEREMMRRNMIFSSSSNQGTQPARS